MQPRLLNVSSGRTIGPKRGYLIFDLHRAVPERRLEEALGSPGWQQERELAVQILCEGAGGGQAAAAQHRHEQQSSSAARRPPQTLHGGRLVCARVCARERRNEGAARAASYLSSAISFFLSHPPSSCGATFWPLVIGGSRKGNRGGAPIAEGRVAAVHPISAAL